MTNPSCPLCKGIGWYEGPYYSDFEPTIRPVVCPACNPVVPLDRAGCALAVALFALFIAFLAWGLG